MATRKSAMPTATADEKFRPECVCTNLRRAARAISQFYDAALIDSGLKITQFSLLRAIARNQPAPIHALAAEMELDRTTLARNLQPLERDRLIVLASGSDKRIVQVTLTQAGLAAVARATPLWEQAQRDLARHLGQGRVSQLRDIATQALDLGKSESAARVASDDSAQNA